MRGTCRPTALAAHGFHKRLLTDNQILDFEVIRQTLFPGYIEFNTDNQIGSSRRSRSTVAPIRNSGVQDSRCSCSEHIF